MMENLLNVEMLASHLNIFLLQLLALLFFWLIELLKDFIIKNWERRHKQSANLDRDTKIMLITLTVVQILICLILICDVIYIATGVSPISIVKDYLFPNLHH